MHEIEFNTCIHNYLTDMYVYERLSGTQNIHFLYADFPRTNFSVNLIAFLASGNSKGRTENCMKFYYDRDGSPQQNLITE